MPKRKETSAVKAARVSEKKRARNRAVKSAVKTKITAAHKLIASNEMEKAKAAGDTKKIKELDKWGKAHQAKLHRQGFSTAPVDDVLEHIKDKLPQIAKDVNVVALVSKWDKKTLKRYKSAELIDVTDLIVAPFNPKEKQLKVIEQIKKIKPIPLWQLEIMMLFNDDI